MPLTISGQWHLDMVPVLKTATFRKRKKENSPFCRIPKLTEFCRKNCGSLLFGVKKKER